MNLILLKNSRMWALSTIDAKKRASKERKKIYYYSFISSLNDIVI